MSIRKIMDKAINKIKAIDYSRVIAEEDGIEIRDENGFYILYVDGQPIADGSLNEMKRLMKEELRRR